MYYGRANTLTSNFTEAIDVLNEGLFVSGKDITNQSNIFAELGRAYLGKSDFEAADKNISKALDLSNNKNGLALEILGDILFKKGDIDGAILQWQKAQKTGIRTKSLAEKIELKKL